MPALLRNRRAAVLAAIGVLLSIVGIIVAWHFFYGVDSIVSATSPEGRYTATVESNFGISSNSFDIQVVDGSGTLIRHLSVTDRHPGWATDPSITWASDSREVTVGLEDPDAGIDIEMITLIMP